MDQERGCGEPGVYPYFLQNKTKRICISLHEYKLKYSSLRVQSGFSQDTVRIQSGYSQETVRI